MERGAVTATEDAVDETGALVHLIKPPERSVSLVCPRCSEYKMPPICIGLEQGCGGQHEWATPIGRACCSTMMTSAAAASDGLADGMASIASAGAPGDSAPTGPVLQRNQAQPL